MPGVDGEGNYARPPNGIISTHHQVQSICAYFFYHRLFTAHDTIVVWCPGAITHGTPYYNVSANIGALTSFQQTSAVVRVLLLLLLPLPTTLMGLAVD